MSPILLAALVLLPLAASFAKSTGKGAKDSAKSAKGAKPSKSGLGKEIVALWDARDKGENSPKLVSALEKRVAADPEDFEAQWWLARACWWIADRSADADGKRNYGEKGVQHGEKAVALAPDRVEGYLWYSAALGEYGLGISIMRALLQGLDGKFRKHCQQAIEIDPGYDGGGPLRAMGRFYAKLPFPKQDLKRSRELLEEAVKLAPERSLTRLYLAETLVALGKPAEALSHLEHLFKMKPVAEERADHGHNVQLALNLCKEIPGGDELARKHSKK